MEEYGRYCKGIDRKKLFQILFNLDYINFDRFAYLLNNQWDNPDVLRGVELIFCALKYADNNIFYDSFVYRRFLKAISILGKGAGGIVAGANLVFQEEVNLAVKAPITDATTTNSRFDEDVRDLNREFIISWELGRFRLPIFSRAFGIFDCSGPLVDGRSGSDVIKSYCSNAIPVNVVYQYIPGDSLWRSLNRKELTANEVLRIYLILIAGLKEAYERIGFVHYDLHLGNIIIRNLPEPLTFSFNEFFLTSRKLGVIIDYGFSRIETKGKVYHKEGYEDIGITGKDNVVYDIYKMTMELMSFSGALFHQLKFLSGLFFPTLDQKHVDLKFIEGYRKRYQDIYIFYPPRHLMMTYDDVIRWVSTRKEFNFLTSVPEPGIRQYGDYPRAIDFFQEIGLTSGGLTSGGLKSKSCYQWLVLSHFEVAPVKDANYINKVIPFEIARFKKVWNEFEKNDKYVFTPEFSKAANHAEKRLIVARVAEQVREFIDDFNILSRAIEDIAAVEFDIHGYELTPFAEYYTKYLKSDRLIYPIENWILIQDDVIFKADEVPPDF